MDGADDGLRGLPDHKLDPISQKDFYRMFSIFNNISEKAMDGNALLPPPVLLLTSQEQEKQLAAYDAQLREFEAKGRQFATNYNYVDPATIEPPPKAQLKEFPWFDENYPKDANVQVNEGNEPAKWISRSEGQVYSGERALKHSGKGVHQVFFTQTAEPITVSADDKFTAWVYLDPADAPKAIMLQFYMDGWNKRANWGDADAIPYGKKDTTEKVQMGELPETGKWVQIEIPAKKLELNEGAKITGIAFTEYDGTT